jgi:hypothetical protein
MKKSDFREWNCLSCPWLYLYEQGRFVRKIEVLKDAVGVDGARTTTFVVDPKAIDDSRIRLQIREEKDETTQLDAVLLTIDGVLCPSCLSSPPSPLGAVDGKYLTLIKGELVELEFTLPEALAVGARIAVETHGYYEPEQCFLERFIVEHSLRSEALSR